MLDPSQTVAIVAMGGLATVDNIDRSIMVESELQPGAVRLLKRTQ
jgi:hypothetical protein